MNKTLKDLVAGFRLYPVWLHQAYYVLGSKYKRTIFGTFWIAGQFVCLSLAFTFVFGMLFHREIKTFLPYAMLGNLSAFTCLTPIQDGPELYMSNAGIIRNYAYPFTFFSFELTARTLMQLGHNLVVFYVFMLFNQTLSIPNWTFIPGLLIDSVSILTWSTVFGMLAARYRDLRYLLPSLTTPLFFLTPVYWPIENLGANRAIAEYNPLYSMVSVMRMPLLGEWPSALNWEMSTMIAVLGCVAWFVSFLLFRRRIPFWI